MIWYCMVLWLVSRHPCLVEMFGEWVPHLVSFRVYPDKVHFVFHLIWVVLDIRELLYMKVQVQWSWRCISAYILPLQSGKTLRCGGMLHKNIKVWLGAVVSQSSVTFLNSFRLSILICRSSAISFQVFVALTINECWYVDALPFGVHYLVMFLLIVRKEQNLLRYPPRPQSLWMSTSWITQGRKLSFQFTCPFGQV